MKKTFAGIVSRAAKAAFGGLVSLSLCACKSSGSEGVASLNGTLPVGCSVAARLAPSRLDSFGAKLAELLAAPAGHSALPGIDWIHDVSEVSFCRLPAKAGAEDSAPFVIALSGPIPADFLERAASAQRRTAECDVVARVPMLGRERLWLARRGSDGRSGDLLIASDRESLRAALVGPRGSYEHDRAAPLSVLVAKSELQRAAVKASGSGSSRLEAVRELRSALSASGNELSVRLVVGDAAAAQRLVTLVQPALTTLVERSAGASAKAKATLTVEAGDVLARIELPKGSIAALLDRAIAIKENIGFGAARGGG